jgi:hypothetical protein
MTTKSVTLGNALATSAVQLANASISAVLPHACGSVEGAHAASPVNTIEWSG